MICSLHLIRGFIKERGRIMSNISNCLNINVPDINTNMLSCNQSMMSLPETPGLCLMIKLYWTEDKYPDWQCESPVQCGTRENGSMLGRSLSGLVCTLGLWSVLYSDGWCSRWNWTGELTWCRPHLDTDRVELISREESPVGDISDGAGTVRPQHEHPHCAGAQSAGAGSPAGGPGWGSAGRRQREDLPGADRDQLGRSDSLVHRIQ